MYVCMYVFTCLFFFMHVFFYCYYYCFLFRLLLLSCMAMTVVNSPWDCFFDDVHLSTGGVKDEEETTAKGAGIGGPDSRWNQRNSAPSWIQWKFQNPKMEVR